MQIFIKGIDGKTSCLDVEPSDSVVNLKSAIQNKTGVSAYEQRLICGGKQLSDNFTLENYKITKESTIHILLSIYGSGNIFSANVNVAKQEITNDLFTRIENNCNVKCEQSQVGNTIFLDGSTTGDITFNQRCPADITCSNKNSIDELLEQAQKLKQDNKVTVALLPNFGSINLNTSDAQIRTQIENVISNSCGASVTQNIQGNVVYARNSKTGDIGFVQGANVRANCFFSNSATAKLNMNQVGDQTNSVQGIGTAVIVGIIIIAIVVLIIGVVQHRPKEESKPATKTSTNTTAPRTGSTYRGYSISRV